MAFKISDLKGMDNAVSGRKKAFLSTKLKQDGSSVSGYLLIKDEDDFTPEVVHKVWVNLEDGKGFPANVVCNNSDLSNPNAPCVACQNARYDKATKVNEHRRINYVFQVYVPEDDTIYLWEQGAESIASIWGKLERKITRSKASILQVPVIIEKVSGRYQLDTDEIDSEIRDDVQKAYNERFPYQELYQVWTNAQMEYYYETGLKPKDEDNQKETHDFTETEPMDDDKIF